VDAPRIARVVVAPVFVGKLLPAAPTDLLSQRDQLEFRVSVF
jgi:hypothetical protein